MDDEAEEVNSGLKKPLPTGFLRFFILRPVEKRHMIGGIIKQYNYTNFTPNSNDTYIYYLLMKYSFILASFFSLLYGLSYLLHRSFSFYLFTIDVWHYNTFARFIVRIVARAEPGHFTAYSPVASMVCSYPFIVGTTLLLIFLPIAWLLFRANVDLDSLDLQHWNRRFVEKKNGDPQALLAAYRKDYRVYLSGPYITFGLPLMILDYYPSLERSSMFLITILVVFSWFYAVMISNIVLCFAIYYQLKTRRGPFFHDKPADSVPNTQQRS